MPVSQVTLECPCCGVELEVIVVGSNSERWQQEVKPLRQRRKRRSKTELAFERGELDSPSGDGEGEVSPRSGE
jgi:hypothetical protein